MTTGLSGKQITCDYNNRPTSVQVVGQTTAYTYGPDGARQTKVVGASETFYAGMAEIRNFGDANESIILQPHPDFRITEAGGAGAAVSYLHGDNLASVPQSAASSRDRGYCAMGCSRRQCLAISSRRATHTWSCLAT